MACDRAVGKVIMLINGGHCSTSGCGYCDAKDGALGIVPRLLRASIWAVIFTQCAATKMTQIDLLKTPTGLPRGTEKNALSCRTLRE